MYFKNFKHIHVIQQNSDHTNVKGSKIFTYNMHSDRIRKSLWRRTRIHTGILGFSVVYW